MQPQTIHVIIQHVINVAWLHYEDCKITADIQVHITKDILLKQWSANHGPQSNHAPPVLLSWNIARPSIYILWLLLCCNGRWVVVAEAVWPWKPKIFTIWLFIEKVYLFWRKQSHIAWHLMWTHNGSRWRLFLWLSPQKTRISNTLQNLFWVDLLIYDF